MTSPMHRSLRRGGFTLVELLVVLAILGVLAAAVMPLGEAMVAAQKERELRQALWQIRGALDEYKKASDSQGTGPGGSGYPPTLQALVDGMADSRPQAKSQRIYFLRQVPRDPFADPAMQAERTWKLRSYASPAHQPQPGADVYDVKSSSTGIALDGSRHDSW